MFLKSFFSPTVSHTKTFNGIYAAKVLEIFKHPNADRLRIIKLDIGDKVIEPTDKAVSIVEPADKAVSIVEPVVCGALNFGVGDMVALALPGANIPKNIHDEKHLPFILEKAKIRGVESQGMICAAFELGIGPLSEKPEILLLRNDVKPGSEFTQEMIK